MSTQAKPATGVALVAVAKADRVLHRAGGEVDAYKATFSGLRCLKAVSKAETQIQCGNADGKQTVLAIYRP